MRALIVSEGSSRVALGAARALGRAGWRVGIGSPGRPGFESASRWVSAWHAVAPPELGLGAFLSGLQRAVRSGGYEVVFGAGDAETLALSLLRDRIGATVPLADHDTVVRAVDKLTLAEAGAGVGLTSPWTELATDEALRGVRAPVLVKARLHWQPDLRGAPPRWNVTLARDAAAMRSRVGEIRAGGGDPLLQEVVGGALLSHAVVSDVNGAIVASAQQVADRTWPPGVGGGVRYLSVAPDEEIAKKVAALVGELGWFGLAQFQFVVPRDGEPLLIDMNGRFFGSMVLPAAAGVNLADAWARLATGRPVRAMPEPRPGVRYQWLEGDLRRAWVERRGGLASDVVDCLRHARGAVHLLLDLEDPRPSVRHAGTLAGRAMAKGLRALGRGDPGVEPSRPALGLSAGGLASEVASG